MGSEMVQGYASLQRRIAAIKGPVLGKSIMQTLAMATVNEAKTLEAPHRKTGNLGRSIHAGAITETSATVAASASYAAYLEFGTKGGAIITPKRAKVLAWGGARRLSGSLRSGSKPTAFAMRVVRGATRAYPYMRPGAEKAITSAGLLDRVVTAWNKAG